MFIIILFFIAYSLIVFLAPNYLWLVGFSVFNLLLSIIFYKGVLKTLKRFINILFFSAFVFLINYLLLTDVIESLIVGWKVLTVAYFAVVFSKIFSWNKIADGIAQLLFPLKIFKVNTEQISLVIVIALSFLQVLSNSAKEVSKNLKARGFKFNLKNLFKQGHIIFAIYFNDIFKRVDAIEIAFKARGYVQE